MTVYIDNGSPLTIPTFDGSGQAVHPSVIDLVQMHGVTSWAGYRYWMLMTPYPYADDTYARLRTTLRLRASDVHRIDDKADVAGVLALGVGRLLVHHETQVASLVLPAGQRLAGPD